MSEACRSPSEWEPGRAIVWLQATRPGFLSVTLLAVLLGFSHADWLASLPGAEATAADGLVLALTLFGALFAHAGANVLNDVADADNGCDAGNVDRIAPYTGGSRVIQDGRLSRRAMHRFGWGLLATSAGCGLFLLTLAGPRLLGFGLAGLLLAVAYSLPPLKLMSRGFGELAVSIAWLLVVVGSASVVGPSSDARSWLAGLPFALHAGMILLVNQVPDRAADRVAGKLNWTARLAPEHAVRLYFAAWLASGLALLAADRVGALPAASLLALAALPIGLGVMQQLRRQPPMPARLTTAIRLNLLQAHLVGALLTISLFVAPLQRTSP